jgi:hypothetical protein
MHLGALFRLNFSRALLPMVSSPFALGDRDFSHSSDPFLAFVWLLITCLSFPSFLFFFSFI